MHTLVHSSGGGDITLINHHMETCNNDLLSFISSKSWSSESIISRYKTLIKHRLQMNSLYIKSKKWHSAMSTGALPPHTLKTSSYLHDLISIICSSSDSVEKTSNPIAIYGERAVITGVYASTELFMLTDESEGFEVRRNDGGARATRMRTTFIFWACSLRRQAERR